MQDYLIENELHRKLLPPRPPFSLRGWEMKHMHFSLDPPRTQRPDINRNMRTAIH